MVKHRDDGSFVRNWCSRIGGIGPGDHLARLSALLVTVVGYPRAVKNSHILLHCRRKSSSSE